MKTPRCNLLKCRHMVVYYFRAQTRERIATLFLHNNKTLDGVPAGLCGSGVKWSRRTHG